MKYLNILCLIAFLACNNCDTYKNEIYQAETTERQFDSTIYNSHLKRSNEPPMSSLNYDAYRFVHKYSLRDTIYVIRIEKQNSSSHLIYKKLLRNREKDSAFTILKERKLEISMTEWADFEQLMYQNDYWTLPKETIKSVLDGGAWIIEGRRPNVEKCGKRSSHIVVTNYPEGKLNAIIEGFYAIIEREESKN